MKTGENDIQHVNPEECFIALVKRLMAIMGQWIESDGVEYEQRIGIVFSDDNWRYKVEIKPNYWGLVYPRIEELRALDVSRTCAEVLFRNGIFREPILSAQDGNRITDPSFEKLYPHLFWELFCDWHKIADRHGLSLSDQQILTEYKRFADVNRAKELHMDVIVPLLGFSTEAPSVKLGAVDIRPLLSEDKNRLCADFPLMVEPNVLSNCSFAISGEYHTPTTHLCANPLKKQIELVITALRLTKPGDFGATDVFDCPRGEWLHGGPGSTSLGLEGTASRGIPEDFFLDRGRKQQYVLLNKDVRKLDQIFRALCRLEEGKGLDQAIRRFHQAYARTSLEDRVLDLCIALESCLLTKIREELRYRLPLRATALLANSKDSDHVHLFLKTLYDIRCQIVHEGMSMQQKDVCELIGKTEKEPEPFLDECENIVRAILKEYAILAADGKTVKEINDSLDEVIVKSISSAGKRK